MADGYSADPEALKLAAKGINEAIGELKSIGIAGIAETGRGFDNLELTGMEAGYQELSSAFTEFCERWSWGVRSLVQKGSEIAIGLGLSAGYYYEQEHYASGVLKNVVAAGIGNPHQSDEQVAGKSWSQVWDDNPINDVKHPDLSAESFEKAEDNIGKTWTDLAKESQKGPGPGGLNLILGPVVGVVGKG